MRTRGSVINGLYEYLQKTTSPSQLADLVAQLPEGLQPNLGKLGPTDWYPATYFAAMTTAVASLGNTEDEKAASPDRRRQTGVQQRTEHVHATPPSDADAEYVRQEDGQLLEP